MLIKIGNFEFTEVWDGVLYKKLSNYPQVTDWEMRTLIEFIEYENLHGRSCSVECEDERLLELINSKLRDREKYKAVPRPRLLTECTACPYEKGCVTDFVCHTTSLENAVKIFDCGKLLSALNARKIPVGELMKESRNAANDPADYFEYIMFAWGNCQAGDRLVMERKLGRFPTEDDLSTGFEPGIRFYFRYEELINHPGAVNDGVLPIKVRDEIVLADWVYRIVVPASLADSVRMHIPDNLKDKIMYIENDCKDIWDWSEKVYQTVAGSARDNVRSSPELIVELREKLHNNPEPSMHEVGTKKILTDFLRTNTHYLEIVDMGLWFYVVKKGNSREPAAAFRADFDAVVCTDGKARHLCGHDGHSSVLAGFALWLDKTQVERDVYLIFQPGEETGMGGAMCSELIETGMIAEIYGFHNIPGYDRSEILLLDHTFACASTGLEIRLIGKQSHAAYPENGVNPAPVISEIIREMTDFAAEKHKGIVLGTVIGIECGSSSYGVSAGEGTLRLTLRAEYQDEYDEFVERIEKRASDLSRKMGLICEIRRIEEFPATINDKSCIDKVRKAAQKLGLKTTYPAEPFRWSEDFGYYLQRTGGAFIGVGCGKDHAGLHTMGYEFEDGIIGTVIDLYKELV